MPKDFSTKFERNFYSTTEFVELFCSGDLQDARGARFNYSNAGYYILGAILERVSGKTYGELLQEKIFGPLQMNDSAYVGDQRVIRKKAYGYRRRGSEQEPVMSAALLDPSVAFSFGGIYSTARDLVVILNNVGANGSEWAMGEELMRMLQP